jgi:hypothetical protein
MAVETSSQITSFLQGCEAVLQETVRHYRVSTKKPPP